MSTYDRLLDYMNNIERIMQEVNTAATAPFQGNSSSDVAASDAEHARQAQFFKLNTTYSHFVKSIELTQRQRDEAPGVNAAYRSGLAEAYTILHGKAPTAAELETLSFTALQDQAKSLQKGSASARFHRKLNIAGYDSDAKNQDNALYAFQPSTFEYYAAQNQESKERVNRENEAQLLALYEAREQRIERMHDVGRTIFAQTGKRPVTTQFTESAAYFMHAPLRLDGSKEVPHALSEDQKAYNLSVMQAFSAYSENTQDASARRQMQDVLSQYAEKIIAMPSAMHESGGRCTEGMHKRADEFMSIQMASLCMDTLRDSDAELYQSIFASDDIRKDFERRTQYVSGMVDRFRSYSFAHFYPPVDAQNINPNVFLYPGERDAAQAGSLNDVSISLYETSRHLDGVLSYSDFYPEALQTSPAYVSPSTLRAVTAAAPEAQPEPTREAVGGVSDLVRMFEQSGVQPQPAPRPIPKPQPQPKHAAIAPDQLPGAQPKAKTTTTPKVDGGIALPGLGEHAKGGKK